MQGYITYNFFRSLTYITVQRQIQTLTFSFYYPLPRVWIGMRSLAAELCPQAQSQRLACQAWCSNP